jgi:hypothetical protein
MGNRLGYVVVALALALTGCKSDEQKTADEASKNMAEATRKMEDAAKKGGAGLGEAMAAMNEAMKGANAGKTVETVDYRQLRDLLPASLPGMTRTNATGEKSAAMGMQVSTAQGQYSSDGGSSIAIEITDIGSLSGLAAMAYGWAVTDYDRESDTGYEKTTTFNGFKAHEKYDKQDKSGELSVLIGNRFIVEVEGNDVEMDAIKAAAGRLDLRKLDGMKTQGVK